MEFYKFHIKLNSCNSKAESICWIDIQGLLHNFQSDGPQKAEGGLVSNLKLDK